MSKFASFGAAIILFLLLSVLVFFGFFILTPKVKEYRALATDFTQQEKSVSASEEAFDKAYVQLQSLQELEAEIDVAQHRHFDLDAFEGFLKRSFTMVELQSIMSEQTADFEINTVDVRATITSPAEYYHFIELLDTFEWVVEVEGEQQFKAVGDGIETHFALKVYTHL